MLAASDQPKGDNAEVVPACSICEVGGGFAPLSRSGSSGAHGGNPTTRSAHGAAAGQSKSGDSTGRKASVKGVAPIRAMRLDENIASLFFMEGKSYSVGGVSIRGVSQAELFPDIDAGLDRARSRRRPHEGMVRGTNCAIGRNDCTSSNGPQRRRRASLADRGRTSTASPV